jgi:adenylosuccinate lyase
MGQVWSEQNKFGTWLQVELAALEGLARLGIVPKRIPGKVRARARYNAKRIREIEATVNHDVIAFLTNVAQSVGADGRYLHFGLTSSDILDTGLALQLKAASVILTRELRALLAALKQKARTYRATLMVGRSHGVHAEPTTFGLKMALFYAEFNRNLRRFELATQEVLVGKVSGAVGTFANVDPRVESYVCRKLGLKPAPISTQIVQRDRHAVYMTTVAIIGASLEKLATEIRLLQKTETREVEEAFAKGQKGSSAMPHKRNPITCERVAGLARILRANAIAALENVALWHERDITHSSVERVILPDSTILLDYMLSTMTKVIAGLVVHEERMRENMEASRGMIFSQGLLLRLIERGMSREKAYIAVQDCARRVWENGAAMKEAVCGDKRIRRYLKPAEIDEVFNYKYHTKHVQTIFKRVGIE